VRTLRELGSKCNAKYLELAVAGWRLNSLTGNYATEMVIPLSVRQADNPGTLVIH